MRRCDCMNGRVMPTGALAESEAGLLSIPCPRCSRPSVWRFAARWAAYFAVAIAAARILWSR